jgi:hypothetical protein
MESHPSRLLFHMLPAVLPLFYIFINLTMLIKAKDLLFVTKELMRASVASGWILVWKFLTVIHCLDTHVCYVFVVLHLILCNFYIVYVPL